MLNLKDLKYAEILKRNKELAALKEPDFNVAVLSNCIVHQLKDILEYSLRSENVGANIQLGDYDNIVQDSSKFSCSTATIIFWELCNLVDGIQYKAQLLSEEELQKLIDKTKSEIDFVIANLKTAPLVILNKFSSLIFNYLQLKENNFDRICNELNQHINKNKPANFFIVDLDKVISGCGIREAVDLRNYFSSKALYSIEFFKSYCVYILPVLLSITGRSKKALIFDCDNTLWKGILGEDGVEGIKMSAKTKEGVAYEYVQNIAIDLNRRGVLIGLNSKNNPEDVNVVLANHPDQTIKEEHIAIKKVNWQDKVSNLKSMASELNIGSDSFVMIDDSDFETNFIHENLPQVSVLQVPKKIHEYPFELIAASQYFFTMNATVEDAKKTTMYKQQSQRENEKSAYTNVEDYLKSLELVLSIFRNHLPNTARDAQLTQKTNQFNLTTKRYTEAEILQFVNDSNFQVFDFALADKFGDYGITGMSIIKLDVRNKSAYIDTMLMSCRVIGRNVEIAFLNFILDKLKNSGIETVYSSYSKTLKNEQVKDFYDRSGFELLNSDDQKKEYKLALKIFLKKEIPYLKIKE